MDAGDDLKLRKWLNNGAPWVMGECPTADQMAERSVRLAEQAVKDGRLHADAMYAIGMLPLLVARVRELESERR